MSGVIQLVTLSTQGCRHEYVTYMIETLHAMPTDTKVFCTQKVPDNDRISFRNQSVFGLSSPLVEAASGTFRSMQINFRAVSLKFKSITVKFLSRVARIRTQDYHLEPRTNEVNCGTRNGYELS